jgi:hypothetical protein
MFEKTSRLAEQVATSVSRRGFLDSLGGWVATAALGVAGVLAGGSGTPEAGTTGGTANQDAGRYEVILILGWEGVQHRHRQIGGLPSFLEGD